MKMSDDYILTKIDGDNYERITNIAGVRTTVCKNRFEVLCQERAETNDQQIIQEFRAWLAKRRQDEMRSAGGVPGKVS
jgi:hypothetical protein